MKFERLLTLWLPAVCSPLVCAVEFYAHKWMLAGLFGALSLLAFSNLWRNRAVR